MDFESTLTALEAKIVECTENCILFTNIYNFIASQKDKNDKIKIFNESDIIKFNVGGSVFSTYKSTIIKRIKRANSFEYYPPSLLNEILSGNLNVNLDQDNAVFIDRNPKYFQYILQYLRSAHSGFINSLNCSEQDRVELLKEADYYKLPGLKELLVNSLKSSQLVTVLDSVILNFDQMNFLMELCNFPPSTKWKLIYRASVHGFQASRFHANCDGKAKTLTIIKSMNSNIFGGYTEAQWSHNEIYGDDPNAFIFSLVNKDNNPLVMKCINSKNAISCRRRRGPVFGSSDISIFDRSNTNIKSVTNLGWNYKHPQYARSSLEAKGFLAGSEQFSTIEIEVFCLE